MHEEHFSGVGPPARRGWPPAVANHGYENPTFISGVTWRKWGVDGGDMQLQES